MLATSLRHTPMSKNKEAVEGRSWWRKHFTNHPGFAVKAHDAYVESDTGQTKTPKVYCKACLVADVQQIMSDDQHAVSQGRLTAIRTEREIEAYCEFINCPYNMIQ